MALQKAASAKVPFGDETKKASPGIGSEVVFLTYSKKFFLEYPGTS